MWRASFTALVLRSTKRLSDIALNSAAIFRVFAIGVRSVLSEIATFVRNLYRTLLALLAAALQLSAILVFLGACAAFLLPFGFQILTWLQTGRWPSLPGAEVGVALAAGFLGLTDIMNWAVAPASWLGLHHMINNFHAGLIWAFIIFFPAFGLLAVGHEMIEANAARDKSAAASGGERPLDTRISQVSD